MPDIYREIYMTILPLNSLHTFPSSLEYFIRRECHLRNMNSVVCNWDFKGKEENHLYSLRLRALGTSLSGLIIKRGYPNWKTKLIMIIIIKLCMDDWWEASKHSERSVRSVSAAPMMKWKWFYKWGSSQTDPSYLKTFIYVFIRVSHTFCSTNNFAKVC